MIGKKESYYFIVFSKDRQVKSDIGDNAVIVDCSGILTDDQIRRFFKIECGVKDLCRGNNRGQRTRVIEEIIYTGQHYNEAMNEFIFCGMGFSEPVVNFDVNKAAPGEMTSRMLINLEKEMIT